VPNEPWVSPFAPARLGPATAAGDAAGLDAPGTEETLAGVTDPDGNEPSGADCVPGSVGVVSVGVVGASCVNVGLVSDGLVSAGVVGVVSVGTVNAGSVSAGVEGKARDGARVNAGIDRVGVVNVAGARFCVCGAAVVVGELGDNSERAGTGRADSRELDTPDSNPSSTAGASRPSSHSSRGVKV